jgi:hypothetical protein
MRPTNNPDVLIADRQSQLMLLSGLTPALTVAGGRPRQTGAVRISHPTGLQR